MKTRKLWSLLLTVSMVLMTACTNSQPVADITDDDKSNTENGWDLSGLDGATWSKDNNKSEVDTSINLDLSDYKSGIGDEYFVKEATYNYVCDNMLDDEHYPAIIKVKVQNISDNIYHVVIDANVDTPARQCGKWDRLDLGYFLVSSETIYNYYGEDATPDSATIKSEGQLVYVAEEQIPSYQDSMLDNEYVQWKDGKCAFHYYNDLTETGFYETLIWDENGKLLSYRSGFGAEAEAISFFIPAS